MRGDFFILNNQFLLADNFSEQLEQGVVVYEVMRIIDGHPLFFEDHFSRLINSCELIQMNINVEVGELLDKITGLALKNNILIGNVMVKFVFDRHIHNEVIYFIPHSYPSGEDYSRGVKTDFLYAERVNPEAKVEQGIKQLANQKLKDSDLYELVLVDRDGYITEGSRSNIFLVKGNKLFSAPLNKILKGITLIKVLELAKHYKIDVIFENISADRLSDFESAFISGTSPGILPISSIGSFKFETTNSLMRRLMKHYNEMIVQDIAKYSEI